MTSLVIVHEVCLRHPTLRPLLMCLSSFTFLHSTVSMSFLQLFNIIYSCSRKSCVDWRPLRSVRLTNCILVIDNAFAISGAEPRLPLGWQAVQALNRSASLENPDNYAFFALLAAVADQGFILSPLELNARRGVLDRY